MNQPLDFISTILESCSNPFVNLSIRHTIIVIEHNTSLIEHVDHIIDLGPNGGQLGGELLATEVLQISIRIKSQALQKLFHHSMQQSISRWTTSIGQQSQSKQLIPVLM